MMKFKLVESIEARLVENTYGMTQRQQRHSLEQTLFSTRMLDIIINNKPMNPGFTLHSNEPGNNIIRDNPHDIFHHLGLWRGEGAPLTRLKSLPNHNQIHNDLLNIVKDVFNKNKKVLDDAFEKYRAEYDSARRAVNKSTTDDEYYNNIGKKLKAYENYFRNVQEGLYKMTDLSFLGDQIDELISKYNTFVEIEQVATEIPRENPFANTDA